MNQSVFRHNVAVFDAMIRMHAPDALSQEWVLWMLHQIKEADNPINSDWVNASHNVTGSTVTTASDILLQELGLASNTEPSWNPPIDYDSWG